jgi:hypothetical protein
MDTASHIAVYALYPMTSACFLWRRVITLSTFNNAFHKRVGLLACEIRYSGSFDKTTEYTTAIRIATVVISSKVRSRLNALN